MGESSPSHYPETSGPRGYSRSKRSLALICFESLALSFCRSASCCFSCRISSTVTLARGAHAQARQPTAAPHGGRGGAGEVGGRAGGGGRGVHLSRSVLTVASSLASSCGARAREGA